MAKRLITKHTILHYLLTIVISLIQSITSSILWLIIGGVGVVIFQTKSNSFGIIVGLPMMLVGFGMVMHDIANEIGVFYLSKNKLECVLCRK